MQGETRTGAERLGGVEVYSGQVRPSIKKNLFLVQRVAKIEASRAAAIFFFSLFCGFFL